MRKADYATLTRVLSEQLRNSRLTNCEEARVMRETTESIARRCSVLLSVDRTEFLKACGIDP